MIDRREQIAARLLALAAAIPGTEAVRNKIDVTARTGPRIVIWDGDEAVVVQKPGGGRGLEAVGSPIIIELSPEIRILAEASQTTVGTTLNGLRAALLAAITADARLAAINTAGSLASIIGRNGDLVYEGCTTAIQRGERVEGALSLQFRITYPLIQAELSS